MATPEQQRAIVAHERGETDEEEPKPTVRLVDARPEPPSAFGWRVVGNPRVFFPDFRAAQENFEEPDKTEEVEYETEEDQEVNYAYAPLEEILAAVRPALNAHNISVVLPFHEGGTEGTNMVRVILMHDSGTYMEATKQLSQRGRPQNEAGDATLYKRYLLESLCGVSATEDDEERDHKPTPSDVGSNPPQMATKALISKHRQALREAGVEPGDYEEMTGKPASETEAKEIKNRLEEIRADLGITED